MSNVWKLAVEAAEYATYVAKRMEQQTAKSALIEIEALKRKVADLEARNAELESYINGIKRGAEMVKGVPE